MRKEEQVKQEENRKGHFRLFKCFTMFGKKGPKTSVPFFRQKYNPPISPSTHFSDNDSDGEEESSFDRDSVHSISASDTEDYWSDVICLEELNGDDTIEAGYEVIPSRREDNTNADPWVVVTEKDIYNTS